MNKTSELTRTNLFSQGGCGMSDSLLRQCIERALPRGQEVRTLIDNLTFVAER